MKVTPAAWQARAISQDTMLELFRKGEILPDGRTNADELTLIKTGEKAPVATQATTAAANAAQPTGSSTSL
jgi:hypothetical protein